MPSIVPVTTFSRQQIIVRVALARQTEHHVVDARVAIWAAACHGHKSVTREALSSTLREVILARPNLYAINGRPC